MFTIAAGSMEDDPVTVSSLADEILSSEQMLREYLNMTKLLAISSVLPVSSVECERGFSTQSYKDTARVQSQHRKTRPLDADINQWPVSRRL